MYKYSLNNMAHKAGLRKLATLPASRYFPRLLTPAARDFWLTKMDGELFHNLPGGNLRFHHGCYFSTIYGVLLYCFVANILNVMI